MRLFGLLKLVYHVGIGPVLIIPVCDMRWLHDNFCELLSLSNWLEYLMLIEFAVEIALDLIFFESFLKRYPMDLEALLS